MFYKSTDNFIYKTTLKTKFSYIADIMFYVGLMKMIYLPRSKKTEINNLPRQAYYQIIIPYISDRSETDWSPTQHGGAFIPCSHRSKTRRTIMIQELPPWHPVFIIWRCLPVLFSLNKAIYLSIEKNTLEVANFNFSMIFVSHKSHKQQWLQIIAIRVTFMDFFLGNFNYYWSD